MMKKLLATLLLALNLLCTSVVSQGDSTCNEKADILFLLDASGSIEVQNFQKLLQFAATFVNRFVLGQVRFSVIRFDSTASIIFGFNAHNDSTSLKNAILNIGFTAMDRDTAGALKLAREVGFSSANGARQGVPKIVIVCTHGPSSNPNDTATEAKHLKESNVLIVLIGIGDLVDRQELDNMATFPEDVFMVIDYNKLVAVVYNYSCHAEICHGVQFADVIIILDSSNSIADADYERELTFVADVTSSFTLGPQDVRFGAIVFGTETVKLFDLKDFEDAATLRSAILSAQHLKSGTDTAKAINFINQQQMFSSIAGGRDNATKIVIILTDGRSNSITETIAAAQKLKADGIKFISIGVGDFVYEEELRQLASGNQTVLMVSTFDALNEIKGSVKEIICYDGNNK